MRNKLICFLIVFAVFLFNSIALAKIVTVTGMGVTSSEAENDALRIAVENTVGVLVDSQTLVEKNVVLRDRIYTNSRGYIRNYEVKEKQQIAGHWRVTIEADVDDTPNSKLMTELTRLGIIDTRLRNPKIAVYIPEKHLRYHVPDPAAETAVIKVFVEAGFSNVIEASPKLARVNVNSFGWALKPLYDINLEDMRKAARFFDADILIMGEGFSEGLGDVGRNLPGRQNTNTQFCRARVEAKMYISQTGQILAADGKYASGADMSESIASKKALAAAGQQLGEYFLEKIMDKGAGNRQSFELVVKGSDFTQIGIVQSALERVNGVKNINLSRYEDGEGRFNFNYSGSPQTLFKALQSSTDADLTLLNSNYNVMVISVS